MLANNAQFLDLKAAAQFGNGYVLVDQYDTQIDDAVRRSSIMTQRIRKRLASGDPSRWVIQNAIGQAAFNDKRSLAPVATSATRTEGAVAIKAITNRVAFGLYDQSLAQVMPQQFQLKAQDLSDMLDSVLLLHGQNVWAGSDKVNGALVGDGTTLEYVGVPYQITGTNTVVDSSSSIVSAIRRKVAELMNNKTFIVRPTAIYVNPMVVYFIEEELKQANNTIAQVEVVPGVVVNGIQTAAGVLPIVPDVFLDMDPDWATAAPVDQHNYPFVIADENLIEFHHLPGSDKPQLFQLGTVANLQEDYVGVMFGGVVVKGAGRAHAKGVVQRA